MAKFKLKLSQKDFFELEVNAKSKKEAQRLFNEGEIDYDDIEPSFDALDFDYKIESITKVK